MTNLESILSQAAALSVAERIQLIDAVLETIPPGEWPPLDEEWMVEIRGRYAD